MEKIISLSPTNLDNEHICCAISDKKCKEGYELKKEWLKKEMQNGYVFHRIDARAKVFIEYGPAEKGWAPILAPGYLLLNCFWVAGKYKGQGYGKALLQKALTDAKEQGKNGLVTIVGSQKFHFMSDTKWLLRQGFESCEVLPAGFSLLVFKLKKNAKNPAFASSVQDANAVEKEGLVAYYSNRCPFTEFHVNQSLTETAAKRKLALKIVKFETLEAAQASPTPATLFSLFYKGKFLTTDVGACMDSRFDKILAKSLKK